MRQLVARNISAIGILLALVSSASAAPYVVDPSGSGASATAIAISTTGDATVECRAIVCIAASGTGNARADCAINPCIVVSGTGTATVICPGVASRCYAMSGTGSATCAPANACILDGNAHHMAACAKPGSCIVIGTTTGASGWIALSLLGHANGTLLGTSAAGDSHGVLAISGLGTATAEPLTCNPPPGATSFCPGAIAVSGLGNANSPRTCRGTFCVIHLAASGTGDADGYFAASGTGHASGIIRASACDTTSRACLPLHP